MTSFTYVMSYPACLCVYQVSVSGSSFYLGNRQSLHPDRRDLQTEFCEVCCEHHFLRKFTKYCGARIPSSMVKLLEFLIPCPNDIDDCNAECGRGNVLLEFDLHYFTNCKNADFLRKNKPPKLRIHPSKPAYICILYIPLT